MSAELSEDSPVSCVAALLINPELFDLICFAKIRKKALKDNKLQSIRAAAETAQSAFSFLVLLYSDTAPKKLMPDVSRSFMSEIHSLAISR